MAGAGSIGNYDEVFIQGTGHRLDQILEELLAQLLKQATIHRLPSMATSDVLPSTVAGAATTLDVRTMNRKPM